MYIDNENFDKWMEKLSKKLTEIGQDLKSLINTDQVLEENERLLDNQDLAFLLKVSFRTLQRYRLKGKLPYFTIGHKTYYRASDIRAFVRERADYQTYKQFEKANHFPICQFLRNCFIQQLLWHFMIYIVIFCQVLLNLF